MKNAVWIILVSITLCWLDCHNIAAQEKELLTEETLKGMGFYYDKDYINAAKWFQKAAEQGNIYAQLYLGGMYYSGQGVSQNYAETVKWFRKAADQGFAEAQRCLGDMYYQGKGVCQNYTEALKWYNKAAEQGNKSALSRLQALQSQTKQIGSTVMNVEEMNNKGMDYYKAKDFENALKWFQKAAEQGYAIAQYNLGIMCRNGEGLLIKDYTNAIKWFEKAAEQGHSEARYNLGDIYEFGREENQDFIEAMLNLLGGQSDELINYVEAANWYRKAAIKGHAKAQFRLGIMYKEGKGVTKNLIFAKHWLQKAAENNNEEIAMDAQSLLEDLK